MNPTNLVETYDFGTVPGSFRHDILSGLLTTPKSLPPKYFYDEEGSRLFNLICETPEYYLTRTEISILSEHAGEILGKIPNPIRIIELGSGKSSKTRLLLDSSAEISSYVPIDISKEQLLSSTQSLAQRFPHIPMLPICADYTQLQALPLMDDGKAAHPLVFFPGSTLGNLDEDEALALLKSIHHWLRGGGFMLVGIDLFKDPKIIEAAYNDAEGITAAFNLNLLRRINHELDADFDLGGFQHEAFFNPRHQCIEMHLRSLRRQAITIDGIHIPFEKEETIHTESSYKYNLQDFVKFCHRAGFLHIQSWTDPSRYFAIALLQAFGSIH